MTIECVVLMVVFAITSLIIGIVYVSYMYIKDINEAEQQIKEAEHRAEVAERALLTACVNLIKDEEDNVNAELLARVVYTNYLRKAKKELEVEQ